MGQQSFLTREKMEELTSHLGNIKLDPLVQSEFLKDKKFGKEKQRPKKARSKYERLFI